MALKLASKFQKLSDFGFSAEILKRTFLCQIFYSKESVGPPGLQISFGNAVRTQSLGTLLKKRIYAI